MSHWAEHLKEFEGKEVNEVACSNLSGDYSFDYVDIVKCDGKYHVVSSSGCSCPSADEVAQHDAGPFDTYEEALQHVPEYHRNSLELVED